jgi:hypothetical protein
VRRRRIPKLQIKPIEVSKNSVIRPVQSRIGISNTSEQNNKHAHFFSESAHLMKDIIFVAYYTINTPYEWEAAKLRESLFKLNLLYDIVPVPSLGNWQLNTRFKAKFMQQMLSKHKGKNIVYVDVDAVVHSIPILFKDMKCDIGIRYQDFRWRKNECLSGTIFMANNSRTMKICEEWEKINIKEEGNKNNLEQWNLGNAIDLYGKQIGLTVENIPPEYTFIFDSMKQMYPNVKPVIEHFQASRRLRR